MHFTDTNFISSLYCKLVNANDNGALKIQNNQCTHMDSKHMLINLQRSFTDLLAEFPKQSHWIMRKKTIEFLKKFFNTDKCF